MENDALASERSAFLFAAKCFYTVHASLSVLGVICNGILLFTAIKAKSLRSPCNILIGSCAFFDFIHQFGAFPASVQIYSGGTMNSWTCSMIQFIPEMGVAGGVFNVLSIGIDRYFSVASPSRYRTMNVLAYLFVHCLAISGFCSYTAFLMVYFYKDQELVCSIPSVFHNGAISLWAYSFVATNIIAATLYFRTWRLISVQGVLRLTHRASDKLLAKSVESDKKGRIFRTILLVAIFDMGGWAVTQFINATQNLFDLPIHKRHCIQNFASIFVNIGVAIKIFIYYFTSAEYRMAIQRQFRIQGVSKVSNISLQSVTK